jgi:hypothetical protein
MANSKRCRNQVLRENGIPKGAIIPTKASKKSEPVFRKETEKVKISFLGGMNEIGKNMTLYEYKNDYVYR